MPEAMKLSLLIVGLVSVSIGMCLGMAFMSALDKARAMQVMLVIGGLWCMVMLYIAFVV